MTTDEKTRIEEIIFPQNKGEAYSLIVEWPLDRLLEWDDDLRPTLVKTLIDRITKFEVKPPDMWYDVLLNPAKFDILRQQELGPQDDQGSEFDPTWRPTADVEREFGPQ